MDESQIIESHYQALRLLSEENTNAAREHFVYALREGSEECDIYRGFAACEPGTFATDLNIQAIFLTRATFGNLTYKAFQYEARELRMAAPAREQTIMNPKCIYQTGFFGVDIPIYHLGNLKAAAAGSFINARNFDKALAILDEAPDLPSVHMMRAALYYRTSRWTDLISAVEPLRMAFMLNDRGEYIVGEGGKPVMNALYQELHFLLTYTAQAHLGNSAIAKDAFAERARSQFTQVAGEAHRMLGLLARTAGDEKEAQHHFSVGLSLSGSEELVRAQANPHEYLRVTNRDLIARRTSFWDIETEPSLEVEQQSALVDHRAELLAKAEAELAQQIGMTNVKKQVAQIRNTVRMSEELKKRGLPATDRSNHIIFEGPPGTGKTTIARVMTDIYGGTGVCRIPKIVEVGRADLVGEAWGTSGPKTKAKIEEARGGVLFIDEAYNLVQTKDGQSDPLGQEAVDVLLTAMENDRGDLVVIIAGYEKELRQFLNTNDGLRSRFTNKIKFETYSPEELADIAEVVAKNKGLYLEAEAKAAVIFAVRRMVGVTGEKGKPLIDIAGNGRFARNIVEMAQGFKDDRFASAQDLSKLSAEEMQTLTESDVISAIAEIRKNIQ